LGVLNGAIPCGFVYFFGIAAASSSSAMNGALVMFVFGISTIPALFLFGFFSSYLQNQKTKKIMTIVSSLLIVVFGFWTILKGMMLLNNPNTTMLEKVKSKHDIQKLYK
jgi:sulfite exporter TauE/SafE